jgi:hypothetical protein
VITSDFGKHSPVSLDLRFSNYLTTVWITDGSASVSYDPAGSVLTANFGIFSDPASAAWFDPGDGTFAELAFSPFANSDAMAFTPPELNRDDGADWMLLREVHPAFRANSAALTDGTEKNSP